MKKVLALISVFALTLSVMSGTVLAKAPEYSGRVSHGASVGVSAPSTLKGSGAYPPYYNAADEGLPSQPKDQQTSSTCWIFAHNELLEINLRKDGAGDFDFSEQTVKFETSEGTGEYGYAKTPNGGGNEYMSTAYLARTGSVPESEEPFSMSEERNVNPDKLTRIGHLNSVPMYDYGPNLEFEYRESAINDIKGLILEYGAVGSSLYYDMTFYYHNDDRSSYNYTGPYATPNHAVVIVGWDDNYSADNFSQKPIGDGAFIVKNSWGNTHADNTTCYFYVSYYDKLITFQFYATDYELSNDNYDRVYQYDYQGFVSFGQLRSKTALCVTNYKAKTKNETLTAVSTYVVAPDTTVEILVSANGKDPLKEDSYVTVYEGYYKAGGYYYIEFDPVKINCLDYSVAVRYTTGATYTKFPVCCNYSGLVNTTKNTPETCYVSTDFKGLAAIETLPYFKNWEAMLCMKAFTKSGEDNVKISDASKKFKDVPKDKWYVDEVSYAVSYGIFGGVSDKEFAPDTDMNRAMFVRVLANLHGADLSTYRKSGFEDVEKGRWYLPAVAWAAEKGIVTGITEKTFAPNDTVSRQQMCTMLVRYCDYLGLTLEQKVNQVTFKDDKNIQSYAKDAVYVCQRAGIISGVTKDTFEPKAGASRAHVATMMMNFCKNYIYK